MTAVRWNRIEFRVGINRRISSTVDDIFGDGGKRRARRQTLASAASGKRIGARPGLDKLSLLRGLGRQGGQDISPAVEGTGWSSEAGAADPAVESASKAGRAGPVRGRCRGLRAVSRYRIMGPDAAALEERTGFCAAGMSVAILHFTVAGRNPGRAEAGRWAKPGPDHGVGKWPSRQ